MKSGRVRCESDKRGGFTDILIRVPGVWGLDAAFTAQKWTLFSQVTCIIQALQQLPTSFFVESVHNAMTPMCNVHGNTCHFGVTHQEIQNK